MAVWFFYPDFTACSKDSIWCASAYWATQSAGKFGTLGVVLVTSTFYATRFQGRRKKILIFLRSFLILSGLLATFAFVNEHVIKPAAGFARPSHAFILKQTKSNVNLDSLYRLTEINRRAYFKNVLDSDTVNFKSIDKRILDHWVEEAGYSFPSGHSFNAFLLASILAFSIYQSEHRKMKYLYFLPLLWALLVALSRVAVGAHSPLDVSFGAAMGLIISHLLLSNRLTRDLIIPKRINA